MLWYDQKMRGGLGVNVVEGITQFVFIYLPGGNFSPDDLTEKTIAHFKGLLSFSKVRSDVKESILPVYALFPQHWEADQNGLVQITPVKAHGGNLAVVIGGVIVDALCDITAGGEKRNFILSVL